MLNIESHFFHRENALTKVNVNSMYCITLNLKHFTFIALCAPFAHITTRSPKKMTSIHCIYQCQAHTSNCHSPSWTDM